MFYAQGKMERAVPILPTDDLASAKTFYVDGLRFQVTFQASDDGHSGLRASRGALSNSRSTAR